MSLIKLAARGDYFNKNYFKSSPEALNQKFGAKKMGSAVGQFFPIKLQELNNLIKETKPTIKG